MRVEIEVIKAAANSYILLILIYIVPTWWSGEMQINKVDHTIKNGIKKLYKKLDLI